ncbi:phytanoyl-CoA dioxygenase family protein [Oceanospirillaceae bacterium]|nr:phytanoyl-CoA dioxygenase family protein [Oceanospirillaceae bacterium]
MTVLTQCQKNQFWEQGFLVVEDVVERDHLASMQAQFASWVQASKAHDSAYGSTIDGRARFDVESGHSFEQPSLRRINAPIEVSEVFFNASMNSKMTDCISDLLGANVKFHHAKINSKLPNSSTVVKWHQDFPFTPHTNDDLITALLMVDDVTEENGPLKVVPNSHKGPIYSLWHNGAFTGAIDNQKALECEKSAVLCTGKAGSVCLMHTRLLHGSSANQSSAPRTLHISVYSAEDAVPVSPNPVPSKYDGLVVRGKKTGRVRASNFNIEMPEMPDKASFFEQQKHHQTD